MDKDHVFETWLKQSPVFVNELNQSVANGFSTSADEHWEKNKTRWKVNGNKHVLATPAFLLIDSVYNALRSVRVAVDNGKDAPGIRSVLTKPSAHMTIDSESQKDIFGGGIRGEGFVWRFPRDVNTDHTSSRISLRVYAEEELIEKLDAFCGKHGVKYKTSESTYGWVNRPDPVTLYFSQEPSAETKQELIDLVSAHVRPTKEMALSARSRERLKPYEIKSHFLGTELAPGINLEKEPSHEDCVRAIENAKRLHPALGIAVDILVNKDYPDRWRLSLGQYEAVKLVVADYEKASRGHNMQQSVATQPPAVGPIGGREQTILANYKAGGMAQAHAAALGAIEIHDRLHGEQGAFLKGMGVSQAEWDALGKGDEAQKMERQTSFVAACQWLGSDAKTMGRRLFIATALNKDLTIGRMEADLDHPEKWTGKSAPQKPTPQQSVATQHPTVGPTFRTTEARLLVQAAITGRTDLNAAQIMNAASVRKRGIGQMCDELGIDTEQYIHAPRTHAKTRGDVHHAQLLAMAIAVECKAQEGPYPNPELAKLKEELIRSALRCELKANDIFGGDDHGRGQSTGMVCPQKLSHITADLVSGQPQSNASPRPGGVSVQADLPNLKGHQPGNQLPRP